MGRLDKNYSEKRDFIRMKMPAELNCRLSFNNQEVHGTCIDLSGGGFQIKTSDHIPLAIQGEALLASNFGHKPQLHARVEVVRVEPDPTATHYLVGCKILERLD